MSGADCWRSWTAAAVLQSLCLQGARADGANAVLAMSLVLKVLANVRFMEVHPLYFGIQQTWRTVMFKFGGLTFELTGTLWCDGI